MKSIVVSYSYTGNNAELARNVSEELSADRFELVETKARTTKNIILDMLTGRKPRLVRLPEGIETYDLVIFMSPIWLFHIPAPMRTCFKHLKAKIKKYAFVSLSGGALGPNTKTAQELVKRLGKKLAVLLDLNSAHFCSVGKNPTTDDTGAYSLRAHSDDLEKLFGFR
jgi:flavodoxin